MAAWCLWGLQKYDLGKADSKFLNTLVLFKLYRRHKRNTREGEKAEKCRARLWDIKPPLTSEAEERSDQFPFFFLEATARPSFTEQTLPDRGRWRVHLPARQAIPTDLWNLRQEIPFSTAFSNETDCQNIFPEDYGAPAQELAEKVRHLHKYNASSSTADSTRAALMYIYAEAS